MSKILEQRAMELHKKLKGKLTIEPSFDVSEPDMLSLVYSPGVGAVSAAIATDPSLGYELTGRGKTIAIISDGTAVLGLGNIGPEAAMPVTEGKAVLLKHFADVDAVPLVVDTTEVEEIVSFCKHVAPSFGGINLEDISAPRCIEIERRVQEAVNIPVFHDDQHGTAIVVLAALHNALKYVGKDKKAAVVVNGTGAAGSAIIKILHQYGMRNIVAFNKEGSLMEQVSTEPLIGELRSYLRHDLKPKSLQEAMNGADVFIGVSVAGCVDKKMVRSMNSNAIVFALANPNPEISYDDAKEAGAAVVATGRSDTPNQVNNVLVFPGLFKGLLEARAQKFPNEIKVSIALGLASLVEDALTDTNIIPSPFDSRVVPCVAQIARNASK